jgi:hypothetical protein
LWLQSRIHSSECSDVPGLSEDRKNDINMKRRMNF